MKSDIILCGVGGQGILSIAAAIGYAALERNLNIKQAEVHGMSQRGGAVQSHLRLSEKPIASDLIPLGEADVIISVEPMESLRYLPYLSEDGWLFTNSICFRNIPDYPEEKDILDHVKAVGNHVIIDANLLAKSCGSIKASNMVMLGAGSGPLGIDKQYFYNAIAKLFKAKGEEVIKLNINAFNQGFRAANEYLNK